jgi:hypothetical protein
MSKNATADQDAPHHSVINASIDSRFRQDAAHRGSLLPAELDSIHQTNSFKKVVVLEEEDNREIAATKKLAQKIPKPAGKLSK